MLFCVTFNLINCKTVILKPLFQPFLYFEFKATPVDGKCVNKMCSFKQIPRHYHLVLSAKRFATFFILPVETLKI